MASPTNRTVALDQVVQSVTAEFEQLAEAAGIRFALRIQRRPTLGGIECRLALDVWPESGFDDFRFPAYLRSWIGGSVTLVPIEDLARQVKQILSAYIAGEVPPGPAFVVP